MHFSKFFRYLARSPLPELKFQSLRDDAILPTRGSDGAIGLDLCAVEDTYVPKGWVTKVPTGLAVEIPPGYYGRLAPRSGLAAKHGIDVLAGVIDDDYRGELVVLLTSLARGLSIKRGERIAQLILEKADKFEPVWAETLDDTERGESGFGSTGK